MADREQWEETSFQVFTDEGGVLRSGYYPTGEGLVTGNVKVAREWGNLPLQPDDDRTDEGTSIGGGYGDVGWSSTYVATSDTLRTADYIMEENNLVYKVPADSHTIATTGYSNFPEFIENYAGDGDAELERIVPSVRGMLRSPAQNKIINAGLDYNRTYVNPQVIAVSSAGRVITVDTDEAHLLLAGDVVNIYYYGEEVTEDWDNVTITSVPDVDQFTFEVAVAPNPALDLEGEGYVWTNDRFVLSQSPAAGTIVNDGTDVNISVLDYD
jgi:hypothetical protein